MKHDIETEIGRYKANAVVVWFDAIVKRNKKTFSYNNPSSSLAHAPRSHLASLFSCFFLRSVFSTLPSPAPWTRHRLAPRDDLSRRIKRFPRPTSLTAIHLDVETDVVSGRRETLGGELARSQHVSNESDLALAGGG
jgi:hypothetical protein